MATAHLPLPPSSPLLLLPLLLPTRALDRLRDGICRLACYVFSSLGVAGSSHHLVSILPIRLVLDWALGPGATVPRYSLDSAQQAVGPVRTATIFLNEPPPSFFFSLCTCFKIEQDAPSSVCCASMASVRCGGIWGGHERRTLGTGECQRRCSRMPRPWCQGLSGVPTENRRVSKGRMKALPGVPGTIGGLSLDRVRRESRGRTRFAKLESGGERERMREMSGEKARRGSLGGTSSHSSSEQPG